MAEPSDENGSARAPKPRLTALSRDPEPGRDCHAEPKSPSGTVGSHCRPSTGALNSCCLVSGSWIPRTRRYLFAHVKFQNMADLQARRNAFPDPQTSPVCYTKSPLIGYLGADPASNTEVNDWIPRRCRSVGQNSTVRRYLSSSTDSHPQLHPYVSLFSASPYPHSFPTLPTPSCFSRTSPWRHPTRCTVPIIPMDPITSPLLSLPGGAPFRELKLMLERVDEGLSAEALAKGCSSLESLKIDCTVRPFPPAFALMAHICS